jgi:plastocyanin
VQRALAVLVLAAGAALIPALPAHAACDVTVQLSPGYTPATKTVPAGGAVTWCWNEGNHSVTFTGGPDSGVRAKDSTYQRAFGTAGTYAYHCSVHSSMQGSVTVQGATPPPTTAPPTQPPSHPPTPTPARSTAPPATTPPPARATTTPPATPPTASPPPTTTPTTPSGTATTGPAVPSGPPTTTAAAPPAATPSPLGLAEPAKPRTGVALLAGLVLAAAALGGAGYLLLRGRRP